MTDPFEGIRHISLDVWSTLIEPNPNFKNARTELFRHFFSLNTSADEASTALSETAAFVNQLNAVSGKCMDRFETILLALQRMGISPEQTDEGKLQDFFHRMDILFAEHPPLLSSTELPHLMQKLADDFTFSILSNTLYIRGASLRQFFETKQMGDFFRFQIYSDEVNLSKPSARIYRMLAEQTAQLVGVGTNEIVHIGDNQINDVEGSVKAGIRALFVDKNQTLAHYFRR